MRTTAGFYPKKGYKHSDVIEEDVEVIKVDRKSDDESEKMSEASEGGGWLDQDDERNRVRALQNKTLWKIMDEKEEDKLSDL